MVEFLNKFLGSLTAIQTKQVVKLLAKMRDSGEIRTHEEFQDRLRNLSKLFQQGEKKLHTPDMTIDLGEVLESSSTKEWMDLVKLDIESMLGGIEQLSNVLIAHQKLIKENYLDSLESSIEELEAKIRALEVLDQRRYDGFNESISMNFGGAIAVVGSFITEPSAASFFTSDRSEKQIYFSPHKDGEVGLHLAIDTELEAEHLFLNAEVIADVSTSQSQFSVDLSENVPAKAIDGNLSTAWKKSIFLEEHPTDGCKLSFAASFTNPRRINSIVLEPVSDIAMKIYSIEYTDSGGVNHFVDGIGTLYASTTARSGLMGSTVMDSSHWILSSRKKIISVGDIIAKRVKVTFSQDTALISEFHYSGDIGKWIKDGELRDYVESRTGDSSSYATMFALFPGTGINPVVAVERARYYEYTFGLKDFYCLERAYRDNGYFVSRPIEKDGALTTLAIHTDVDYGNSDADVELLLRKENFTADGSLLDVEEIPIPAYADDTVSERFFPTRTDAVSGVLNSGYLRFYPNLSEDFVMTENGVTIAAGTQYLISVDNGTTWEEPSEVTATPAAFPRCLVKIIYPRTDAIYVASYTPAVSGSGVGEEVFLNVNKTAWLDPYQIVNFRTSRETGLIAKSRLVLRTMLRATSFDQRTSPYLKELVILSGA